MAYISKDVLLKAYKTLSKMRSDPNAQGATQNVSALRHFIALDRFFAVNNRDCNTRDTEDKKQFVSFVGLTCQVDNNYYTPNFYYPLKSHNGDFNVGSNFYSAGQVSKSLVNKTAKLDYPTRGSSPLMTVRNGVLLREESLYHNLDSYLENARFKVAFVIWLLRNEPIQEPNTVPYISLASALNSKYTIKLVNSLFPDTEEIHKELQYFDLQFDDYCPKLSRTEIESVFSNNSHANNNDVCTLYLSAIRTKPFLLLAGISGTGKSRIVRRLAQAATTAWLEGCTDEELSVNRWNIHKPQNFEIIQVKPNWHNSMDVVGYQTNIPEPHYVFTPFVEYVAKAWLHPDVPFFLCLDEMNLAPVEEYFAEFLSAIESRSKKGGEYETDPLIKPFSSFGEQVCKQMLKDLFPEKDIDDASKEPLFSVVNRFKTKGLTLPENLIVIGTVNMDETTCTFSRKVLDRAMSFEMNEVDYDSFIAGQSDVISTALSSEVSKLLTDREIDAKEVVDEIDSKQVLDYLKAVNVALEGTPFKLGYRAANEALLYVSAAHRFRQNSLSAALDEFTLMKILSRIEGDKIGRAHV